MIFRKHKKDHTEQLLMQAQPPHRVAFETELRERLLHGVSQDSPIKSSFFMSKHMPFRFAFPAGIAAVLALGTLIIAQPWDRTNAVIADSIQHTFSIGTEDSVRYIRMKEELVGTSDQGAHSSTTEYWLSGAQSRVDVAQERNGEPALFSTVSLVGSDSRITQCEYTNDALLSTPLLQKSSVGPRFACGEKKDVLPFNHEDVNEYRDIQPSVTLPVDADGNNIIFVQWDTVEPIAQNIHGYAYPVGGDAEKDDFAEYTYYTNTVLPDGTPAPWDFEQEFMNRKTETGYTHSVFFPDLNKYIPDGKEVGALQFQIQDDQGYSQVYQYDIATQAVTILGADQLKEQAELYRAGVIYDMVTQNQSAGSVDAYEELFTELLQHGHQTGKTREVRNNETLMGIQYSVSPGQYMVNEVTFLYNEQSRQLREVTMLNVSGETRTVTFEENTVLSGVEPATFFTQEAWKASLK